MTYGTMKWQTRADKVAVASKNKISKGKVVAPAVAKAFSPEPETESRRMAPSIIKVSGERKL